MENPELVGEKNAGGVRTTGGWKRSRPRRTFSDVRLYPATPEAMLARMMAPDHAWLAAGGVLPVGSSVLAAGMTPARA